MTRFAFLLISLAVVVAAPAPAAAQTGLNGISRSVAALDKNFDIADKNHDGKLSKDEAKAGPVSFIARNFDAIDTSQTGLVSKEDVHAYIAHMLMRSQPASPASTGKPD